MELLANGGFEDAGSTEFEAVGWTAVRAGAIPLISSYRSTVLMRSGAAAWNVSWGLAFGGGPDTNGAVYQDVATSAGAMYAYALWVKRTNGDGVGIELVNESTSDVIDFIAHDAATDDWQLLSGIYQAPTDLTRFRVQIRQDGNLNQTSWAIDDASVAAIADGVVMPSEPYHGYLALLSRLRGVSGSAFHHQVGDKVLGSLRFPGQNGAPEAPYFCVTLEDEGPEISYEGEAVLSTMQYAVYGWVPVSEFSVTEEAAAKSANAQVLKLYADFRRAMFRAPGERFENAGDDRVQDIRVESKRLFTSPNEEGYPPHFRAVVAVDVLYSRATLGPEGV